MRKLFILAVLCALSLGTVGCKDNTPSNQAPEAAPEVQSDVNKVAHDADAAAKDAADDAQKTAGDLMK